MSKNIRYLLSAFFPATALLLTAVAARMEINTIEQTVLSSGQKRPEVLVSHKIEYKTINREEALNQFFEKHNSPLSQHTQTFIEVADKYNLDYRLLPAISCIESSCGKRLIPDSYNPFGWGIYGNKVTKFSSYDEAIEKVGEGLNRNYIGKGLDTPAKIAPVYTPPNPSGWLSKVTFFINQITESEKLTAYKSS